MPAAGDLRAYEVLNAQDAIPIRMSEPWQEVFLAEIQAVNARELVPVEDVCVGGSQSTKP